MIDKILSVANALFSFSGAFQTARREKRDRIADLFDNISKCIAEISTELKSDNVPHGKCAEMLTYANMLTEAVKDEIGKDTAEKLAQDLIDSHEVELLLGQLHDAPDRDNQLRKLDEASGVFMALANIIRAS